MTARDNVRGMTYTELSAALDSHPGVTIAEVEAELTRRGYSGPFVVHSLLSTLRFEASLSRHDVRGFANKAIQPGDVHREINRLRGVLQSIGWIDVRRVPTKSGRTEERWFYAPPRTDGATLSQTTPSAAINTPPEEGKMLTGNTTARPPSHGKAYADAADLAGISAEEYAAGIKLAPGFQFKTLIGHEEARARISFEWVDPKLLRFDEYARDVDKKRVEDMGSNVNWLLANCCVLNRRADAALYIIDGGHRVVLAIKAGVPVVLALVIDGLTAEEESLLAGHFNRDRKQATGIDKFSMLVFGRDPESLALKALVEETGFRVATKGEGGAPAYAITAIETLRKITATSEGSDILRRTLGVIRHAWYGRREALQRDVLVAISRIVGAWPDLPGLDKRLTERIQAETYPELLQGARAKSYSKHNLTAGWVEALCAAYNFRLQPQNQLDPNVANNVRPGKVKSVEEV